MALIIGHIDHDGYCSAVITALAVPNSRITVMNYGWIFNRDLLVKEEPVYIVDFTLPISDMEYLISNHPVYWFDHHADAVVSAEAVIGRSVPGIRRRLESEPNVSSCMSVWTYFHPDVPPPKVVRLIDAYDVWDHKREPCIVELNRGLSSIDIFPIGQGKLVLWERLFYEQGFVEEIIERGTALWTKERETNANLCRFLCEYMVIEGYNAVIANLKLQDSYVFESAIKPDTEIMVGYYRYAKGNVKYWKFSLRSVDGKDIDVAAIARKYGGNGHRNSAGFSVKALDSVPFMVPIIRS